MQLMMLAPMFPPEDYGNMDNGMIQDYRESMISQLDAEGLADGLLRMEKALAENAASYEELNNLQNQTQRYTPESLDKLMPQAKPPKLFTAIGFKPDARMQVFDDKQFAAYAAWFTGDNLELFKAMQKIALISGYSQFLSEELAQMYGYGGGDAGEAASEAVQSYLSDELGQIYVARCFKTESKAEIEKMVRLIIDAFEANLGAIGSTIAHEITHILMMAAPSTTRPVQSATGGRRAIMPISRSYVKRQRHFMMVMRLPQVSRPMAKRRSARTFPTLAALPAAWRCFPVWIIRITTLFSGAMPTIGLKRPVMIRWLSLPLPISTPPISCAATGCFPTSRNFLTLMILALATGCMWRLRNAL